MEDFSLGELAAQTGTSRRRFLAGVAGVAGAVTAAGVLPSAVTGAKAQESPSPRAGGAEGLHNVQIGLFLDGTFAAALDYVEGGEAFGDVVVMGGTSSTAKKHVGNLKYSNVTLKKGASFTPVFANWLASSARGTSAPRSGEVVVVDSNGEVRQRREFFNALVTEIGLPPLDATSKDAAKMTIKFAPEYTQQRKAGGRASFGRPGAGAQQKHWLPANFKLEIDGLDCSRVSKVDALTIKQKVVEFERQRSTVLEFPNLTITLPESSSQTWSDWFDDFVIRGNSGDDAERSGTLTYLAPDGDEILRLRFEHLGIFKLTPEAVEAHDSARVVTAELYCEDIAVLPPTE